MGGWETLFIKGRPTGDRSLLELERMKEKRENLRRGFGETLGDSTKNRRAYHSRRMSLNINTISTSNHICAYYVIFSPNLSSVPNSILEQ